MSVTSTFYYYIIIPSISLGMYTEHKKHNSLSIASSFCLCRSYTLQARAKTIFVYKLMTQNQPINDGFWWRLRQNACVQPSAPHIGTGEQHHQIKKHTEVSTESQLR